MKKTMERFAAPVLLRAAAWPVLVLPLALAGCNTVQDPMLTSPTLSPTPTASGEVASVIALASLSAFSPKVKGIRQSETKDGLEQIITLADRTTQAGENMLTVEIGKAGLRRFQAAPDRAAITREMQAALPGMAMTIAGDLRSNIYGAYGYATGRAEGGTACVYAWQVARDLDPLRAGGMVSSGYAAQIRLRYCEPARAGTDLAGLMAALKIKPVDRETIEVLKSSTHAGFAPLSADYLGPVEQPALSYAASTTRMRPEETATKQTAGTEIPLPATTTAAAVSTASNVVSMAPSAVAVPLPE